MKFHNQTRKSKSIPRKLLRQGKLHLLPVYCLTLLSELGREGVINGGSHDFADHIYKQQARGRWGIGYMIDWIFLRLKSARAMRYRYVYSLAALQDILSQFNKLERADKLKILALPSGYAREVHEALLSFEDSSDAASATFMDLNQDVLNGIPKKFPVGSLDYSYRQGDAFNVNSYSDLFPQDVIISHGFIDFLDDAQVVELGDLIYNKLKPGGVFLTSCMKSYKPSEYLLRELAELRTKYRHGHELQTILEKIGFVKFEIKNDPTGILSFIKAYK